MPGGIENIGIGYATYAAIKFVGYSLAGVALNRAHDSKRNHFALVGAFRTVIGLVLGAVYGGLAMLPLLMLGGGGGVVLFLLGLVPLRFFEWWLTLEAFYDGPKTNLKVLGTATAWSFVLDIPAIAGLVSTGGFWIC